MLDLSSLGLLPVSLAIAVAALSTLVLLDPIMLFFSRNKLPTEGKVGAAEAGWMILYSYSDCLPRRMSSLAVDPKDWVLHSPAVWLREAAM